MPAPKLHVLRSRADLRAVETLWDDLWRRSDVTSPMSRASLIDLWLETFAHSADFFGWVVEHDSRFVAAIPFVAGRWARFVPIGGLTSNDWCCAGQLLLDPTADAAAILPLILEPLRCQPWAFVRLPYVRTRLPHWRAFTQQLAAEGFSVAVRDDYEVPLLSIDGDWETYRASWTSSHRTSVSRYVRKLAAAGEMHVELRVPTQGEVADAIREVCPIEDASWKGTAGTSILRTDGMAGFLQRQGERLAALGHLEVSLLRLDGRAIAFEWLWNAKGVLHGYKVGYDAQFAKLSPGVVLLHEVLRDLFTTRRCHAYDFLGEATEMLRRWSPQVVTTQSLIVAPPKLFGRTLLFAYRRLRSPKASPAYVANAVACPTKPAGKSLPGARKRNALVSETAASP